MITTRRCQSISAIVGSDGALTAILISTIVANGAQSAFRRMEVLSGYGWVRKDTCHPVFAPSDFRNQWRRRQLAAHFNLGHPRAGKPTTLADAMPRSDSETYWLSSGITVYRRYADGEAI
jgi:hypothetical protein